MFQNIRTELCSTIVFLEGIVNPADERSLLRCRLERRAVSFEQDVLTEVSERGWLRRVKCGAVLRHCLVHRSSVTSIAVEQGKRDFIMTDAAIFSLIYLKHRILRCTLFYGENIWMADLAPIPDGMFFV